MAKVEYKISYNRQSDSELEISGKFNYIEKVETVVNEENKHIYPLAELGSVDVTYNREKAGEFLLRFPIDTTEQFVDEYLKNMGSIYGEVINE